MGLVFHIGFVAAAFVPTFLISRVIFRLTKRWEGSMVRLVATNCISGLLCVAIFLAAALWFADGAGFDWAIPIASYTLAQAVWLALDILTDRARPREGVAL